jgi:hypothetical protein
MYNILAVGMSCGASDDVNVDVLYISVFSFVCSYQLEPDYHLFSMPPDKKQSAPLHVPQFTATNYSSFFLAGQSCTCLLSTE